MIRKTKLFQRMPFNLEESTFMKLYFGNDQKRLISYSEFTQFLHVSDNLYIWFWIYIFLFFLSRFQSRLFTLSQDFHEECGTIAFKKFDQSGTGFITAMDFEKLMLLVKNHLLTDDVKNNLLAVSCFVISIKISLVCGKLRLLSI